MRLYFAILGVGKRSLWCAGFTNDVYINSLNFATYIMIISNSSLFW